MRSLRFPLWCPLLAVLLLGFAGCASPGRPPRRGSADRIKPVVTVMEFENRSGFSGQWRLGNDMADLLVSELMSTGKYRVVERQRLGGVVGELNLQQNDHFRQEGRVERGRLINARFQIRGVITDFSQTGGGGFWMRVRRVFFRGAGYQARVALTLTVVDVESGEILASVQSSAEARAREAYASASYRNVDFGGDSFSRTPLGSAAVEAIRTGIRKLDPHIPRAEWRLLIADSLEGGGVLLNGGRNRGLSVGDEFRVLGPVRTVTDPASGDVLSRIPGPDLGRVRVVRVDETISFAESTAGGDFRRGDRLAPR